MRPLHIAIASTTSLPGQVDRNLQQIRAFAEQAGRDGADLLLTPELSASGYGPYPEVLATAEIAGAGPIYRELAAAAQASGVVIGAGFVEAAAGKRHLAHYVVWPDSRFVVQRKHRVTLNERPLDPAGELRPPDPAHPSGDPADPGQPIAPNFNVFTVKEVRAVVVICADFGIPNLDELLAAQGVELVLGPTGAGGSRAERVTNDELRTPAGQANYLRQLERVYFPGAAVVTCLRYRRALAAVNLCGYDGRRHYHVGHGSILNPMGEVPALIHGLPNLDRQRPLYTHAIVDLDDHLSD